MEWANAYVGIPFAWAGSDRGGASCWGLVRLVQREVFGRELPDLFADERVVQYNADGSPVTWLDAVPHMAIAAEDAQAGDLLHMWGIYKGKRLPLHVGVHVSRDLVLHAQEGTHSVIQSLRSPMFRWRAIQAYRCV